MTRLGVSQLKSTGVVKKLTQLELTKKSESTDSLLPTLIVTVGYCGYFPLIPSYPKTLMRARWFPMQARDAAARSGQRVHRAVLPALRALLPPRGAPAGKCIKIGLPGKSILGDYFQEKRTSRRSFLFLRIYFPGRPIFNNSSQIAPEEVAERSVRLVACRAAAGQHFQHESWKVCQHSEEYIITVRARLLGPRYCPKKIDFISGL